MARGRQQPGDDRRGADDLLQIVQQQQNALVGQILSQVVECGPAAALADAHCVGDGRGDEGRVGDGG